MMKKSIFILLMVTAVTMSVTPGTMGSPNQSGTGTILSKDLQQKKDTIAAKVVYTCPMHPEVVQDKSGKCPKCGMKLAEKSPSKVVYTCPMHPEVVQDKTGKCPKCGMNLAEKSPSKVVYTCPMHPEVVQDKLDKCPKCGMNLVKKATAKK